MSNFCCWVKSKNSGSYSSDLNIFLTLSFFLTFLKPCDFPVIKHGRLYYAFKGYFPASVGQRFSYRCNRYFVTPSQSSWDYMTCTLKGWSPEVPCLRQCTFNYLENGYYTNSQEKYLQGKTVRVRCHDGYSLHNNQNTMTCTEKGWYPPPICVRRDCSAQDFTCGGRRASDQGWLLQLPTLLRRRTSLSPYPGHWGHLHG
uniref:Sushi domain-containing protein n=1 Tax=Moschus moschiferus TaxID=68415 RepID=A0A8C6D940_MOSMO